MRLGMAREGWEHNMTGDEAIKILLDCYHNVVVSEGRGSVKSNLRTALLMGANAIKVIQNLKEGEEGDWILLLKEIYVKKINNNTQYAITMIIMVILFYLFAFWVKSW